MKNLIIICICSLLAACGTASLESHSNTEPELRLERFFSGDLRAYGIVLDRSGNLLRRFEVDMTANWDGDKGEIMEWFRFDDGERSTRLWRLTRSGPNQYQGEAEDVVGIASGEVQGSALYWKYVMEIPVDDEIYEITLDDWMFLLDENRLFNRTDMTKFGFKVGEIILFIEKL